MAPKLLHVSYVSQASYSTHITLCQQLTEMPKLADVEKGPLPKAQCAANIEYGTRLGKSSLERFSTDEV